MIIKPKSNQSIFDVAIITTGDPLNAFEIAFKSELNVTDEITDINIDYSIDKLNVNHNVLEVFKINNYQPATFPTDIDGVFDRTFDRTFE